MSWSIVCSRRREAPDYMGFVSPPPPNDGTAYRHISKLRRSSQPRGSTHTANCCRCCWYFYCHCGSTHTTTAAAATTAPGPLFTAVAHLEVDHPLLLVLRAEPRLRTEVAAARLLVARRQLALGALDVHHALQSVQAAAPTHAIGLEPVAVRLFWRGAGEGRKGVLFGILHVSMVVQGRLDW